MINLVRRLQITGMLNCADKIETERESPNCNKFCFLQNNSLSAENDLSSKLAQQIDTDFIFRVHHIECESE